MIQCLTIQLQGDAASSDNVPILISALKSIGRYPEVETNAPNKGHVSLYLNLFTETLNTVWQQVEEQMLNHPEIGSWLKDNAIIVANDMDSANTEAQLLFHYDDKIHNNDDNTAV